MFSPSRRFMRVKLFLLLSSLPVRSSPSMRLRQLLSFMLLPTVNAHNESRRAELREEKRQKIDANKFSSFEACVCCFHFINSQSHVAGSANGRRKARAAKA